MPNPNPRIERLKTMLGLEEKRALLQEQLDALQSQLSALKDQLFDDASSPAKAAAVTFMKPAQNAVGAVKGRSERGALKEQILTALSAAGSAGVRVTELAAALGIKAANIHAWFHSTGKKIPGLTKLSGGHYRLKDGVTVSSAPRVALSSKSRGSKQSKGGTKRGQLSSNIIGALEAAGDKGLKIKEIADQVGANYRNVSVWFVTTGKNYPNVKKVGAAHYKIAA
jgi:hypothetical protein